MLRFVYPSLFSLSFCLVKKENSFRYSLRTGSLLHLRGSWQHRGRDGGIHRETERDDVFEIEGDTQREKEGWGEESVDEIGKKRCRSPLPPSHQSYFSAQFR